MYISHSHCIHRWQIYDAKQSIKECRDRKLLLPLADLKAQWKKAKRSFTVSVKTPKGTGESYFEWLVSVVPQDNEPSCFCVNKS
jgi:hypothetical protein